MPAVYKCQLKLTRWIVAEPPAKPAVRAAESVHAKRRSKIEVFLRQHRVLGRSSRRVVRLASVMARFRKRVRHFGNRHENSVGDMGAGGNGGGLHTRD